MQSDIDLMREIENPAEDVVSGLFRVPEIVAARHVTIGTTDPITALRCHFVDVERFDIVQLIDAAIELVQLRMESAPRFREHLARLGANN
jgi:hypothetical protein